MKKKLLATALALVMLLSLLPSAALAADVGTADALQSALSAGGSVKLTANVTGNFTVPSDKSVTLDLNGHTITNTSGHTITVENGATLTITGTGTVDNVTHARAAVWNEGTVTLSGGTYTRSLENGQNAEENGGNSYYALVNHGTMTVNSGVSVTQNGHYSSLFENGYYDYNSGNASSGYVQGTNAANPELTINGGTFMGGLNTVKNDDGGILTINGGTFSNTTQAAVLNWNKATINGGSFTVDAAGQNCIINGAYATDTSDQDSGSLTINGGIFTSPDGVACIHNYFTDTAPTVTGGIFSSGVSQYMAEGYTTTTIGDQTVVVTGTASAVATVGGNSFSLLANAVNAATGGQTVMLLDDCTADIAIIIDKNLTLDLNGHVVSNGMTADRPFQVTAAVDFIIEGTTAGSGMTIPGSNTGSYGFIKISDSATVTLNGGTYTGNTDNGAFVKAIHDDNVDASGCTVNLNDVTMSSNRRFFSTDTLTTGASTPTLQVTGGTYTSEGQAFGVDVENHSPVTFTNVTVTAGTGPCIEVCGPAATFTDCTFTVTGTNSNGYGTTAVATSWEGTAAIDGGTYSAPNGYGAYVYNTGGTINIEGGTVSGGTAAVKADSDVQNPQDGSTVSITGGNVNGAISIESSEGSNASLIISGGYFTSDPSAYCADSLTGLPGSYVVDGVTYSYTVGKSLPTNVEVAPGSTEVSNPNNVDSTVVEAIKNTTADGVTEAANAVAADVQENEKITVEEYNTAAEQLNSSIPEASDSAVTTIIAPRLDIEITSYSDEEASKSLTLEIEAVYDIKATTNADNMEEWDGNNAAQVNTVTIQERAGTLNTEGTDVKISISLPAGFPTTNLYVEHTKNGAFVAYHEATVTSNTLTFTNDKGFSTFRIAQDTRTATVNFNGETLTLTPANVGDALPTATSPGQIFDGWQFDGIEGTYTVLDDNLLTQLSEAYTTGGGSTPVNATPVFHTPSRPVTPTPTPEPEELPFTDVADEQWFYEAVKYVYDAELMNGITETTFEPDNTTTRGMIVTVLYRMAGSPAVTGENAFTDVEAGSWYADAIDWAAENGIVEGYGDGTFFPDNDITREQMATILYRYAQYMDVDVSVGEDTNILSYADFDEISEYAIPALQWACGAGVITGVTEDTLVPQGTATRAQVSTILMRYCETVAK